MISQRDFTGFARNHSNRPCNALNAQYQRSNNPLVTNFRALLESSAQSFHGARLYARRSAAQGIRLTRSADRRGGPLSAWGRTVSATPVSDAAVAACASAATLRYLRNCVEQIEQTQQLIRDIGAAGLLPDEKRRELSKAHSRLADLQHSAARVRRVLGVA